MADESYEKTSRCWPGYEPVPSKGEHQEGSCRKKPASKNGGKEVDRETARKKQVKEGGVRAKQAKGKSPDPSERRSVSKSAAEKTASKRAPAKKTAAKKTAAKKTAAKKTAAKKSHAKKATGTKSTSRRTAAAQKKAPAKRTQSSAKKSGTRRRAAATR